MFEDDQDSLFGSPPPSPIRAQNSLQRQSTQLPRAVSSVPSSSGSTSISRSSTKKRKSTKSKSSTPRPEPPPIAFPGPDDPVPSNFLRSQKALLGIAGLVGDVNLPHQALRGSTPSNPIIIEEPDPMSQSTRLPLADLAQLPPVSGKDVMTSLIKQKNIFPVLSSILKLLGNSPDPLRHPPAAHTPSFSRPYNTPPTNGPPPLKRRKLTSVPAGAVDWDVPYPFPEGEGPEAYHATWERERAKQLMVQLLELLKSAVQGAAARKHAQKEMKKRRLEGVGTSRQGSISKESSIGILDSRSSTVEPTTERCLSAGVERSTDSLDDFLASLFSDVPSHTQDPLEAPNTLPEDIPQFDESLFDKWIAELQAIPPPEVSGETTPVTPVPCLDDLIRSNRTSPARSATPPVQSTQKPEPVVPLRVTYKPIDKENILRRTRERRRQIVAEIERAKVELWETSIEGGVLGQLIRDPSLS